MLMSTNIKYLMLARTVLRRNTLMKSDIWRQVVKSVLAICGITNKQKKIIKNQMNKS